MKIVCLECHRVLGEKYPFNDPTPTHTICSECIEHKLGYTGKEGLRRQFSKPVGREG